MVLLFKNRPAQDTKRGNGLNGCMHHSNKICHSLSSETKLVEKRGNQAYSVKLKDLLKLQLPWNNWAIAWFNTQQDSKKNLQDQANLRILNYINYLEFWTSFCFVIAKFLSKQEVNFLYLFVGYDVAYTRDQRRFTQMKCHEELPPCHCTHIKLGL